MEPQKPSPGNLPVESSDPSFQVMPQEGRFDTGAQPAAPLRSSSIPSAAPPKTMPPPPPGRNLPNLLPDEPQSSFFGRNWIYILGGIVVLIVLGLLAYFILGSKKTETSPDQTVTSKLPKVWLVQYFNKEVCDDQTVCGDDADSENDGLKNYDEFKAGTSPVNTDSDADGLADGDEVNIYKTEATLKYTDRRDIVAQSDWTDGFQIKNGYDPLTPGLKFTDARNQQIADDTAKFSLHQPTLGTLSNGNPPAPSPNPTSPGAATPKIVPVTMQNNLFNPSTLIINKGDTVVWTNKDSVAHTVIGDSGGPASGNIPANGIYNFEFNTVGIFSYHCSIHPTMIGSVDVR